MPTAVQPSICGVLGAQKQWFKTLFSGGDSVRFCVAIQRPMVDTRCKVSKYKIECIGCVFIRFFLCHIAEDTNFTARSRGLLLLVPKNKRVQSLVQ